MTDHIPNPGSPEAKRNGCRCDAKRNRDGHGIPLNNGSVGYVKHRDCPLHPPAGGTETKTQ